MTVVTVGLGNSEYACGDHKKGGKAVLFKIIFFHSDTVYVVSLVVSALTDIEI